MHLKNKTALVTGGSTGMGWAIAQALARAGADVAICGLPDNPLEQAAETLRGLGVRAITIAMDQGKVADCVDAIDRTARDLGGPDILVNCAAALGQIAPVAALDEGEWEAAMRVNLTGLMVLCREAVRRMTTKGGGAIINIASGAARTGVPNRAPYVAAKWAMLGFSQTLALETARDGIRVNSICPGPVLTERLQGSVAKMAASRNVSPDSILDEWTAQSPMGRFATPEEIGAAALFLASDAASGITGQAINVSAGQGMN